MPRAPVVPRRSLEQLRAPQVVDLDHAAQPPVGVHEQALEHPTWSMGARITIDSATLMNKGLEVIEAHWLFGLDADRIEVVVHPTSVVHSMIELVDGSFKAQLGVTDMRHPIQYAMTWPDRCDSDLPPFDPVAAGPAYIEIDPLRKSVLPRRALISTGRPSRTSCLASTCSWEASPCR